MESEAPLVAISDPGEVGRAAHNKGDRIVVQISNFFSWLYPILMIVICTQVILRTAGRGGVGPGNQAWMDDLQWWIYGMAVLIGIAYAVTTDSHVRVDIFYDEYSKEKQAKIDCFALAWCFLPFVIMSWDITTQYAISAVVADEGSDSPNGLHNLWILKVFMNISFLLIAFATWSAYNRRLATLMQPALWQKLLYAFPSFIFALNIAIYWLMITFFWTTGEHDNLRSVTREDAFDNFEWMYEHFETAPAVLYALIAGVIIIGVLRLTAKKEA